MNYYLCAVFNSVLVSFVRNDVCVRMWHIIHHRHPDLFYVFNHYQTYCSGIGRSNACCVRITCQDRSSAFACRQRQLH